MLQNNIITINDNPVTLNQKLARIEANAIIEDFLKDFGFDLLALPNLDLPLKQYEQALVEQAWIDEVAMQEEERFDCSLDKEYFNNTLIYLHKRVSLNWLALFFYHIPTNLKTILTNKYLKYL